MVFQPFKGGLSLYKALEDALDDKRFTKLTVVVAWARDSGLKRIRPMLQSFRDRGGTARILLGIDKGGATVEGLHAAIADFDEALVLHDAESGTFHPKFYIITGEAASIIIIGSNNLTKGGLFKNYEAGVCLELDLGEDADVEVHEAITHYIQRLQDDDTCRLLDEPLVQQLHDDASLQIGTETQFQVTDPTHGSENSGSATQLFGKSQHKMMPDPAPPLAAKSATMPEPPTSGGVYAIFGHAQPTVNDIKKAIGWLKSTMGTEATFTNGMRKLKSPLLVWVNDHYPGMKTKKPSKPQILKYLSQSLIPPQDADTAGS